ncbi:capsule polysaccharide export protein-like protein [Ketogulonicigenium vulgare Y25]|uniref:Capsule polysaccharide export protein-like protein n=2 Tax=Ketogulonicigenium vulgare TaxID=92945 RepID=F9Y819_KETVW|nr:capsule polysaccharide transporter [Ketogulonicigenium vulgare]ADO42958.1 capsule polysaccharide export protein-like protein [Ketogulonicigenium vulgare Y25]AEM41145.1 Capsule polysaccharide export protein-like protein [Ketogulonicigenium vulgare WSH-001]ALJ81283.1 capsule biosynthesis protein [Ketogulonicigenium vulgare]ANW34022.1 capsule biosynthesis protein [Ketogulonicigenium vulgare]AOZ54867.1 capsule polysaccharide export protein-like protein [Ketogulonicigenium vulgare]
MMRLWSFLGLVALPALLSALYFGAIASDRYAANASFVVRSIEGGGGGADMLSSLTGMTSAGSTRSDSYVLGRFLHAPDMLRRIDAALGFDRLFADPAIDALQRLDPAAAFEDRLRYWRRHATSRFDATTSIFEFEVEAYSAQDAVDIANLVLDASVEVINRLSEEARSAALQQATQELQRAEDQLRAARAALTTFRTARNIGDPTINLTLQEQRISTISGQISSLRADVASLERSAPQSPALGVRRNQLAGLTDERDRLRAEIAGADGAGALAAAVLSDYEDLQMSQEFAQQYYASALTSYESARANADRQQRYLAVFADPYPEEIAKYPYRILTPALIFLGLSFAWLVGLLLTQLIWDHRR